MDSSRIPESGWLIPHRVGDLVKILNRSLISVDDIEGAKGVVVRSPTEDFQGLMFVEVFVFKLQKTRHFAPQELEIISNIDDRTPI